MRSGAILSIGLALLLVLSLGAGHVSAAEYCPDHFIFFLDQSGSM